MQCRQGVHAEGFHFVAVRDRPHLELLEQLPQEHQRAVRLRGVVGPEEAEERFQDPRPPLGKVVQGGEAERLDQLRHDARHPEANADPFDEAAAHGCLVLLAVALASFISRRRPPFQHLVFQLDGGRLAHERLRARLGCHAQEGREEAGRPLRCLDGRLRLAPLVGRSAVGVAEDAAKGLYVFFPHDGRSARGISCRRTL
mmetsp:Transcript_33968/g.95511  ORF Transcript_33968/g.95511 Transcript_33968/m.95511 type:complete len:200 (-) Transcript_33968:36-635(-)